MITGPVKFQFKTGTIDRSALAFWCVMMEKKLFDEIGLLDEIFSPGMGEDGDFCIKAELAGHQLVQVPNDASHEFGTIDNTKPWSSFPMYHKGSGTFGWLDAGGLIERNKQILNERYGDNSMNIPKYSIVIPTYNHCDDLLKPCLESIIKYTDMTQVEVIVVANGCTDNTREYVNSLGDCFKLIWIPEAAGYTKSTNEGIKVARGEYVILLNNDTEILDSKQHDWINLLEGPFKAKKNVGLTGPLQLYDRYAASLVLIFFCVMVKKEVFEKIGLLDEIFSPGGGEDIDFSIRAKNAGYLCEVIEPTVYNGVTNVGSFPIWHKDNKTFGEIPEYTKHIVKRNGVINAKKYNKDIKLNLGAGGVDYDGYLSVDLYDKRAHINMDIGKLEFDDNTVSEILASHVFEHLNPYHVWDILSSWFKTLKPGGKLIMEMPNIEELCRRFITASKAERYGILNAVYGSVNTTDVGTPDQITSPHLFGWWPEAIWDHLVGVGFTDVKFMAEKIPHPESNFRVEATKPALAMQSPIPDNHKMYLDQEPITYNEIFVDNAYNLTKEEIEGAVVIDVGANLGFFSIRCLELGAKKVYAVEAQPTVYTLGLLENVKSFDKIVPLNAAMIDVDDRTVLIPNNHVASSITSGSGEPVSTITLETLIKDIKEDDLVLKLDCEGSEFEIVLSSKMSTLRRFKTINMELHSNTNENPAYHDIDLIRNRLTAFGFKLVNQSPALRDNCAIEKWARL